jgi:uncharacterized repeat protein (TIGR03803 family)
MKSTTLFSLVVLTLFTSLIPAMHAQTYSVIHSFTGIETAEGGQPSAGVTIRGSALFGTTNENCGSVYQLTNTGSNWLFSTLARLSNNCQPVGTVAFGPDGHLYGTSMWGGAYGAGTDFKLTPQDGPCRDAACYWTVSDLHDFDSNTEGYDPGPGDLIWDQQGNIYGTTQSWGNDCCLYGDVYQLAPSGNGYTENILHVFSGPDGAVPYGVISDNKGNLFGVTNGGGLNELGTVFELTYVPGVGWTEKVLYNFQGTEDGAAPFSSLIFDSAGNLYGTTIGLDPNGGTIFELSPSGDSWVLTTLYSLPSGDHFYYGVVFGPDGALYGTFLDATDQAGSVFKLTKTQNGWQYTSLHDFGLLSISLVYRRGRYAGKPLRHDLGRWDVRRWRRVDDYAVAKQSIGQAPFIPGEPCARPTIRRRVKTITSQPT